MNRNDFGLWGVELSREKFSQAFAALGVILGEDLLYGFTTAGKYQEPYLIKSISQIIEEGRPLMWSMYSYLFRDNYFQDFTARDYPAQTLADVWENIIQDYGEDIGNLDFRDNEKLLRLNVEYFREDGWTNRDDISWIIEELSSSAVKSASVYVNNFDESNNIVWDFPLRVGLFDDLPSRRLRAELEELKFYDEPLVGTYIKIVETETTGDCDILLLPHSLRTAAGTLLTARAKDLRCDCVIVTGQVDESGGRLRALVETVRTQARAAGVCLLPVPDSEVENYHLNTRQICFKEFIRQVSHNYPIDAALFRASRQKIVSASTPLFFASSRLIREARISRRIEQFRQRISAQDIKKIEIELTDPAIEELLKRSEENVLLNSGLDQQETYSLDDVSSGLYSLGESLAGSSETEIAPSFGQLKTVVEEALKNNPPSPNVPRRINVEISEWNEGTPRSVIEESGLRMNATYLINVFIGQTRQNSLAADKAFNEAALPPGKNEHELTVFFTESNISPEPKVATIVLPREGDSSECTFFIRIAEGISEIRARIIIAYKNRVLQTAILKTRVYAPDVKAINPDAKIELLIESVVSSGLQDLTNRKWFDAAFVINHDQNAVPQMTTIVERDAAMISIAGIVDKIKWFDDTISDVANRWEKFETLESKNSQTLLRNCALNGAALYKSLLAGRLEGTLAAAQRIQIVTAKYGARLPLEFVYGRRAPEDNAPLCRNAKKALLDGHCDAACPVGRDEKKVICPLGFWGLNRVIERHAFDAEAIKCMPNADFALQSDPVEGRRKLNILTNAVLAASKNVDAIEAGSTQKVVDALESVTGKHSNKVNSWKEWLDDINSRSPSLLVLLPHTLKDIATGEPTLEISENERLLFARIEEEYILGPNNETQPVVILMGCKTAAPDIAYESFILEFRRLGAALVVGTGSTILGRHAATVTTEFIKAIAEAGSNNTPFGDIMLAVRRKMIADGLLMALCFTSYGDTDWTI